MVAKEGRAAIVRRLTPRRTRAISGHPSMDTRFLSDVHRAARSPFSRSCISFSSARNSSAMKQHEQMVENLRRGDTVVTAGGVVGAVAKVPQKDDPEITVEIADSVQVKVIKATLTEVRAKTQPVEAKSDKS